jgi:hypothetical protein
MTGFAVAAGSAGAGALADSLPGNLVLIGFSIVGLLGAGALLGTARELRAERRDPLNARHYIDF